MKQPITTMPKFRDRGSHVETLQLKLVGQNYFLGNIDGAFGNKTKNAIYQFQIKKGIVANGLVDDSLLEALDLEVETTQSADSTTAIISLIDQSRISKLNWNNRGIAPYGYYYGMGLTFAKLYGRLKQGDVILKEITKPLNSFRPDSLYKFDRIFADLGMNNSTSDTSRLRHIFVLMFGLGIMESSGRCCCGWDRGKLNGWGDPNKIPILPEAKNSEAGLFQTSYDIIESVDSKTKNMLRGIFDKYKIDTNGLLEYFSKGAYCSFQNEENFGDGEGKEFQKLSKEIPIFTVEFNALALRNITGHWNPVIKMGDLTKGLEIRKECDEILQIIENYVDSNGIDGVPISPKIRITSIDEKKISILQLANDVGQQVALNRAFDFAPESQANYWGVVDFNKPSSEERFFIFNLNDNSVKKYLVAHGKNSGDLYATTFSNTNGSFCSSLGIYKTSSIIQSYNHGSALELKGLEATNSNAKLREIILHKADYVASNYNNQNMCGQSLGCFAVQTHVINEIIDCLRDGSYLIAWHS